MKIIIFACISIIITGMLFSFNANAQQGFGTNVPSPSAVIDMVATNKGVLFPRIALTSLTDVVTIPSPANSLTVFNTATSGVIPNNVFPGYYYYNALLSRWVRLLDVKNNYYNGLILDAPNNVGLGGLLDHNTVIKYNDKTLTFLTGDEGLAFPGSHSAVLDKNGLKLRYNDGGSGIDPSIKDYYLSIENTRTSSQNNSQLGTSYDGITTGIKSIFSYGNANNQQFIGGQFGSNVDGPVGSSPIQIGVLSKVGFNTTQATNSQVIAGYFSANNQSTGAVNNYGIYTKATGVNPFSIYSDGGAVLIKDLDNTATPVLTGVRPIFADAMGKLVIGASASTPSTAWTLAGNAPTSGDFFGTTSNFDIPVKVNNKLQYTIKEGGIDFNPAATTFDLTKPWYQLRMFNTVNNNENGLYMYKDGSAQLSSYETATGTINNFFTTLPGTTLGYPSGAYIQSSNGATTQTSLIATQFNKITISNSVPTTFKGAEYDVDYSANYSPLSLITKKDLTNGLSNFDATNDAFTNNTADNRVELNTKADGATARAIGTQFAIRDDGRVGIGTNVPIATLEILSNVSNSARITSYGTPNDINLRRAQGTIGGTAAANNISGDGAILGRIIASGLFNSYRDAASITMETDGAPNATNLSGRIVFSTTPLLSSVPTERLRITRDGNVGIGTGSATSALLNIAAGTASANSAPIKLTSGVNLTSPEAGAVEYDGTNFFATNASSVRYTLAKTITSTATLDFPSTVAQSNADLTITVSGAADGDVVSLGIPNAAINANSNFTAWVSAANIVKIRFNNYSTAAIDPAGALFRVSIIKY